jgi:TetR/AcrR family transcriptional repressor of mexJK operon
MTLSSLPVNPRPAQGRPKDLEKRSAILEAAKNLFVERGFEATSMDAVAAHAGVSKLTVYSHFQDKSALFVEAVKCKCEEQLPHELFEGRLDGNIEDHLRRIARGFHSLVVSPESIAVHRMMAMEAARSQADIGRLFFEAGPQRTLSEFEAFLRLANAQGMLNVPDPRRAAGHFFCMLKGVNHLAQVCGCATPMSAADAQAHIDSVVDLFLRAYGR